MTINGSWAADEFRSVDLGDKRLNKRLIRVAERLADAPQQSIPAAMEGWDETQAAYRLFQNEKVTMESILQPHAESTMRRVAKESTVLVLQDTTELDFTSKRKKNRDAGPLNYEERVGFYLHPSVVVTPEGLHLGTIDAKLWSRDEADFGKQVDRKKRPFEEKESVRWRGGTDRLDAFDRPADRNAGRIAASVIVLRDALADRSFFPRFQDRLYRRGIGISFASDPGPVPDGQHDRCLAGVEFNDARSQVPRLAVRYFADRSRMESRLANP